MLLLLCMSCCCCCSICVVVIVLVFVLPAPFSWGFSFSKIFPFCHLFIDRMTPCGKVELISFHVKYTTNNQSTYGMLRTTSITKLTNNLFRCRYILMIQTDSLLPGNDCEKLKHGSIIIGWWDIHWSEHLLCNQVYILVDISPCNESAWYRTIW